jgi:hypothetical protein
VVGLLPLASGQACFEMAFPAFLIKKVIYRCDSVVIGSSVGKEKVRMTVG